VLNHLRGTLVDILPASKREEDSFDGLIDLGIQSKPAASLRRSQSEELS
jgi:hypothetical protein